MPRSAPATVFMPPQNFAVATAGSRRTAAAACLVVASALMPGAAQALEGSALFAVGESGARKGVRSAAAPLPVPSAPSAAVVNKRPAEKPVARRAARGGKAAKGAAGAVALNGRWEDSQCSLLAGPAHQPQFYIKRQYDFEDKRKAWQLSAAVHTAPDCAAATRLLTYYASGTFAVAGKPASADAYETSFKVERRSAIPETRDGVLTLLNGRCGSGDFEKGRPLDLSLTGCPTLGIRPIAQVPREIELVRVTNGKVFLGSSSFVPGGSDARQAQLSGYGLSRIP